MVFAQALLNRRRLSDLLPHIQLADRQDAYLSPALLGGGPQGQACSCAERSFETGPQGSCRFWYKPAVGPLSREGTPYAPLAADRGGRWVRFKPELDVHLLWASTLHNQVKPVPGTVGISAL